MWVVPSIRVISLASNSSLHARDVHKMLTQLKGICVSIFGKFLRKFESLGHSIVKSSFLVVISSLNRLYFLLQVLHICKLRLFPQLTCYVYHLAIEDALS